MKSEPMYPPDEARDDANAVFFAPPMSDPKMKFLLKTGNAAEILSISKRKLWAMTNTGEIPCVRFGRAVRYDPTDLRAWIDAQKGERR